MSDLTDVYKPKFNLTIIWPPPSVYETVPFWASLSEIAPHGESRCIPVTEASPRK